MNRGFEDRVLEALMQNISIDASIPRAVADRLAQLLREKPSPSADEVLQAISEALSIDA